ncbi:MAG: serine/threonine-protein kinase, partial [Phycisphaerales bacterium]
PYIITREIGRGGMGVVYLARDTRLDRDVAIKALPEHLAADSARLARFEREAKTLAQLSHPNIAAIYGVEEHAGVRYLVLEYVEGESLADYIQRGPIPVDDAIEIAVQIAAGVEAAHEAGVIHRDLKPDNIRITPDGKVKVLDFGLARSETINTEGDPESPTLSIPAASPTIPGAILGTAAYMSPEQARGKPIDKRTDIWSLGVILHEMLTGENPFAGESVGDSIGAVLHKEVDLARLPAATPERVRVLLERMLRRDRSSRWRSAGDAVLELNEACIGSSMVKAGADSAGPWRRRITFALVLVTVASMATAAWFALERTPEQMPEQTPLTPAATPRSFQRVTHYGGAFKNVSISPDEDTVVYSWRSGPGDDWDIYSQRVGGFNRFNLTEDWDPDATDPALSPDGQRIVFRSSGERGGLFLMGATGESPQRLTEDGYTPAWSPEGSQIAYGSGPVSDPLHRAGSSLVYVVDANGNEEPWCLTDRDGVQPSWSPDGQRIVFWSNTGGQRDLCSVPADGSAPATVITNDMPTDWSPVWNESDGRVYFISDRSGAWDIWRVEVDPANGATLRDPEPVTVGLGDIGWLAASADGRRMVYVRKTMTKDIFRAPFDADADPPLGDFEPVVELTTSDYYPAVSPDGKWLVYVGSGQQEDIFLVSSDGKDLHQVTDDRAKDRQPRWLPDGSRIYFYSDRSGQWDIWSTRPDGSDPIRHTGGEGMVQHSLSPDGNWMAVNEGNHKIVLVDPTLRHDEQPEPRRIGQGVLPEVPESSAMAAGWLDDQSLCVLSELPDGSRTLYVFDIETEERLAEHSSAYRIVRDCIRLDERRLLFDAFEGLVLIDLDTWTERIVAPASSFPGVYEDISLDTEGGWLYVSIESVATSDIWAMDLLDE